MKSIRARDTKPEILVRKLLHEMGYRFRLHRRDLPGCPDIVLPKYKAVVFVHGCFWHRHDCPNGNATPATRSNFWNQKFKQTIKRDELVTKALKDLNWRVLIIWECQIKKDRFLVKQNIELFFSGKK